MANSKLQALWNHPAGPKTIHFWAPTFKWGITIANILDSSKPPDQVSYAQQTVITSTGLIWARFGTVITPKNWNLVSVSLGMAATSTFQLTRKIQCSASVDVVPLFLGQAYDMQIDEEDLTIVLPSKLEEEQRQNGPLVYIHHKPTCISVQSSGERSHFANKMKAMNRLKAKLLILALEQGVTKPSDIRKDEIFNVWQKETRRYMSHPYKLVKDAKTGIQLPDLMFVLDGNLEPLIAAHINIRQ